MKPKIILVLGLVLTGGWFAVVVGQSIKPSAYLEAYPTPDNFKPLYSDSEYQFCLAFTSPGLLVFNQKRREWKRVAKVSLENAQLGHQPRAAEIYMNFSSIYKNKDYAPIPLRTGLDGTSGFSILPDKVDCDTNRSIYRIFFNSNWRDDALTTVVKIRKQDLDESFSSK